MATFYEKNGGCTEQKANIQIDLEDIVTWINHEIKVNQKNVQISPTRSGTK
jgi:hypothetical protein